MPAFSDYLSCFEPAFSSCGLAFLAKSGATSSVTLPAEAGGPAEGSCPLPEQFAKEPLASLHVSVSRRLKAGGEFNQKTARQMNAEIKQDDASEGGDGGVKSVAFTVPVDCQEANLTLYCNAKVVASATVTLEENGGTISEWVIS